jgi:hypothetical protein
VPLSDVVKGEKSSDDELFFGFGYASEEGVSTEAGLGVEGDPASPGLVAFFVGFFLF